MTLCHAFIPACAKVMTSFSSFKPLLIWHLPWETFLGCFHPHPSCPLLTFPQCSMLPLTWLISYCSDSSLVCLPYFLICLLFPRLGTIFEFTSISSEPVHLNSTLQFLGVCWKMNDPGLPVSQSQRRQLLSAEPVRTCLVSPEEGVKKHDQVHLSPTESPPCSAPESPSFSLTTKHSNLLI